ncbi:hypothetical protein BKA63DRAFT_599696 [Paraphoma chrysanthemicola]|nr:hypothetical protein BKA63DRAFT_599696 [Paraphoma chrysanthemicola]
MHDRYYDSQTLSDILIRYGNHGERTFFGHKLLLATKARWFEAAFTGGFAEATHNEMTLKDDDPETVEAMFKLAYDQKIDLPNGNPPTENAVFAVALFKTADKYDYQELEVKTLNMLGEWINAVIDAFNKQHGDAALQSLLRALNAVYVYEEETSNTRSMIKMCLMSVIFKHESTTPLGTPSLHSDLVNAAAAKIPEFGRDLYLGMVERRDSMSNDTACANLDIEAPVRCPTCNEIWSLYIAYLDDIEGCCWECGVSREDWRPYVVKPCLLG